MTDRDLLDTIAAGVQRIEVSQVALTVAVKGVQADLKDVKAKVGSIERKLDRHEVRIEELESKKTTG